MEKESIKPLQNVNVHFKKDKKLGTSTNIRGEFLLKLGDAHQETDSVFFSIVGFKTLRTTLSLMEKDSVVIFLPKQNISLKEVAISNKRKQKRIQFQKVAD